MGNELGRRSRRGLVWIAIGIGLGWTATAAPAAAQEPGLEAVLEHYGTSFGFDFANIAGPTPPSPAAFLILLALAAWITRRWGLMRIWTLLVTVALVVGCSSSDGGDAVGYGCDEPDPDWLFCEDFSSDDGDFDAWLERSDFVRALGGDDRGRIDLSDAHATSGDWSVYMPAAEASGYQGAELVWYACDGEQTTNCDLRGYDKLYFRAMVRFAEDHQYVHHFLRISGLDRFWRYGSAGCMPNGESAMGTTVDFDEGTHETFFYTYHLDMGCDTSCDSYADAQAICDDCADKGFPTCEEQQQCCWGDNFRPEDPVALPVGQWFCLEMMMEANTAGASDGRMAYWVDDALAHEVDGLRWRTTEDLQLDRAGLQHYIAEGDADSPNRVWFDDVVVSTERIGCPR